MSIIHCCLTRVTTVSNCEYILCHTYWGNDSNFPQIGELYQGLPTRETDENHPLQQFQKTLSRRGFHFFFNVAVIRFRTTETGCFSTFSRIWLCATMCIKVNQLRDFHTGGTVLSPKRSRSEYIANNTNPELTRRINSCFQ